MLRRLQVLGFFFLAGPELSPLGLVSCLEVLGSPRTRLPDTLSSVVFRPFTTANRNMLMLSIVASEILGRDVVWASCVSTGVGAEVGAGGRGKGLVVEEIDGAEEIDRVEEVDGVGFAGAGEISASVTRGGLFVPLVPVGGLSEGPLRRHSRDLTGIGNCVRRYSAPGTFIITSL
jgi:hypothetical protein